jgi:hypothetical protein
VLYSRTNGFSLLVSLFVSLIEEACRFERTLMALKQLLAFARFNEARTAVLQDTLDSRIMTKDTESQNK